MSRTKIYNHNRFDGGMTHNKRDTSDLTKFAHLSHLDIYRDHSEMHVMPGYEPFHQYDGNAVGLKTFDIQDIAVFSDNRLMALGKKSNGTGSKIFIRDTTDFEWVLPTVYNSETEGSNNLVRNPFLTFIGSSQVPYFPVNVSGEVRIARFTGAGYNTTLGGDLGSLVTSQNGRYNYTNIIEDTIYFNLPFTRNIRSFTASTATANAKSTNIGVTDVQAGDYTITLAGTLNNRNARNLIWDSASLLADQNNAMGKGVPLVALNVSGMYAFVVDEFITDSTTNAFLSNGKGRMVLKALLGESPQEIYSIDGFQNAGNDIYSIKALWRNAPTWYSRIAQDDAGTSFVEGVWAYGKDSVNSQMGVSILLDTSSLGYVRNVRWIGNTCYLINHSGTGSVSKLQDFETGTYDVPATIETLIYGADSPYLKQLKGLSIVTEDLPAGGSVVCSYRTDEDSVWITMGTSNTTGQQKHNFTKANGSPIGRFQEIQFKIVITGKVTVKNILVAIEETEDLSF